MKQIVLFALSFVCAQLTFGHSSAFTSQYVDTLVKPYLQIQEALAADDFEASQKGATSLLEALKQGPKAADAQGALQALSSDATGIASAADIKAARVSFVNLSAEFKTMIEHVGTTGQVTLYLAQCPMAAEGKGAEWVQASDTVANPYFGKMMLRCGSARPLE